MYFRQGRLTLIDLEQSYAEASTRIIKRMKIFRAYTYEEEVVRIRFLLYNLLMGLQTQEEWGDTMKDKRRSYLWRKF